MEIDLRVAPRGFPRFSSRARCENIQKCKILLCRWKTDCLWVCCCVHSERTSKEHFSQKARVEMFLIDWYIKKVYVKAAGGGGDCLMVDWSRWQCFRVDGDEWRENEWGNQPELNRRTLSYTCLFVVLELSWRSRWMSDGGEMEVASAEFLEAKSRWSC